jgi:RHS repeat-associated protein
VNARVRLLPLCLALLVPTVASAQQAETIEYYGTDAIGSIRIVWDANGNVLGRQDYAPFGKALFPIPAMPKEGFVGNEQDAETDQGNFHARMFEARAGRFTRPDPIQDGVVEPQRWNRYAYALNQPVSVVDPTGLRARGDEWNGSGCNADAGKAAENSGDCFPELWDWQWGGVGDGRSGRTGDGTPVPGTPAPQPDPPPAPDPPNGDPPGCEAVGLAAAGCQPPPGPTPPTCNSEKGDCRPPLPGEDPHPIWNRAKICAASYYGLDSLFGGITDVSRTLSGVAATPIPK